MRYEKLQTKILDDGTRVLKTKIFKSIPKRNDDIYIITQETDRLDTLANQFYGDSTQWWVISHANNLISADIGLQPGTVLRIPKNLTDVINFLNE